MMDAKATTVTLPVGRTAELNTCGSCYLFWFREEGGGECQIKLPPHIAIDNKGNEKDYVRPANTVKDDFGCSFWKHSGKTYIVQRRIAPPGLPDHWGKS